MSIFGYSNGLLIRGDEMKVKVQITETLQRVIELDIVDKSMAIDIIMDQYDAEEIVLDANDLQDVKFSII